MICRLSWPIGRSAGAHLHGWLRASAGVALTCLGSRVGALKPLPHRLLHPAMIGGHVTTEFLRDVPGEDIRPRGAAAAVDDDCAPILEGLGESIGDASTHVDADAVEFSRLSRRTRCLGRGAGGSPQQASVMSPSLLCSTSASAMQSRVLPTLFRWATAAQPSVEGLGQHTQPTRSRALTLARRSQPQPTRSRRFDGKERPTMQCKQRRGHGRPRLTVAAARVHAALCCSSRTPTRACAREAVGRSFVGSFGR